MPLRAWKIPCAQLMLAFTLPAILFGAVGGIFVDRFKKC